MDKEFIYKIVFYSRRLLNGLLFYVGWFTCVVAAAKDAAQWALVATAAILAVHFILYNTRKKDLILLITLSFAGLMIDTSFMQLGWLSYQSPNLLFPQIAPFWIMCLHSVFSTSINHSMSWLKHRPLLSAVLGSGGIAWTYLAGERLGAVNLLLPNFLSLLAIGVVWFFYLPLVYAFSVWLDKKFGDK